MFHKLATHKLVRPLELIAKIVVGVRVVLRNLTLGDELILGDGPLDKVVIGREDEVVVPIPLVS